MRKAAKPRAKCPPCNRIGCKECGGNMFFLDEKRLSAESLCKKHFDKAIGAAPKAADAAPH